MLVTLGTLYGAGMAAVKDQRKDEEANNQKENSLRCIAIGLPVLLPLLPLMD